MHDATSHSPNPAWWQPEDQTAWDRVKAALQRDWEQTKADLSSGRRGTDLNQELDDTVRQAFGRDPIPPDGIPNPLTTKQVREKLDDAVIETGDRGVLVDETGQTEPADWYRREDWHETELPHRYGFGAARFYPNAWDDALELRLRTEWSQLCPDKAWVGVREAVRTGWTRGRAL